MRTCCLLLLLACDHRPAPKPTGLVDVAVTADATPVPADDTVCLQIGAKIAEIIISSATDATQKAAYEQERTKLVKRFSESCREDTWSDATRGCFLGAKTSADLDACSKALAKLEPAAAPAPHAAGAL